VPFSATCFGENQPGGIDPACAPYDVHQGTLTLPGCCGPRGCGAYTTLQGFGCIANEDLGRPAVTCHWDPLSQCPSGSCDAGSGTDSGAPRDAANGG